MARLLSMTSLGIGGERPISKVVQVELESTSEGQPDPPYEHWEVSELRMSMPRELQAQLNDEMWSSPQRRALETASDVAAVLGFSDSAIQQDDRIRERMNWLGEPHQTRADFAREWAGSTADRDFQPAFGDSSHAAGDRFAAFLTELRNRLPDGRVIVVVHDGVTVDLFRTWFGEDHVEELAPCAIEHGILPCGITAITLDKAKRTVLSIGADAGGLTP